MATIANLLIKIGSDITSLTNGMNAAQQKVSATSAAFTKAGTVMTLGLTVPILAAAAASYKFASDVNESLNKVEVSFGRNADEIKQWSKTTLTSIGLAQGTALDMAATYGDMATSMSFTTTEAAKMGKEITARAADMASFKNISIDIANTAMSAIFTGETESLKRMGVVMTQVNLQEYAYQNGIDKTIDKMTQKELVQLRLNYVMAKTINSEGDFARTADGAANTMKVFTESLKELGASMGTAFLPAVTSGIKTLNEIVQSFIKMTDEQKRVAVTIGVIVAAIGPLLVTIGALIKAIAGIKGALAVLKATTDATTASTAALNASLLTNPYVLIGVAVAALIAYLTAYLIKAKEVREETKEMITEAETLNAEKGAAEREQIYRNYDVFRADIEKRKSEAASYSEEIKASLQSVYDEDMKLGEKQLQSMKDAIEEKKDLLRDEYDSKIDAINKEYDALIEIEQARKEQHNERMKQYTEEYMAQIGVIDAGLAEELAWYQTQIDSINSLTDEENKAIKDRANAQKIADLESTLAHSYTLVDKAKATKDLNDELAAQERERLLTERSDAIEILNLKMEDAVRIAKEEKEKLQIEYDARMEEEKQAIIDSADLQIAEYERIRLAKEKEEEAKYKAAQKALDNESDALDTWLEDVYRPAVDLKLQIALDAETIRHDTIMADLDAEALKLTGEEEGAIKKSEVQEQIDNALAAIKILTDEMDKAKDKSAELSQISSMSGGNMTADFENVAIGREIKGLQEAINEQWLLIKSLRETTETETQNRTIKVPVYEQGTPYVPETGLALLHKGESVTPAEQNGSSGITIYATYNVTDKATAEYANSNLVSVLQARGLVGGFR